MKHFVINEEKVDPTINGFSESDLLTVEGQITLVLIRGPRPAGDIYGSVTASQPTVSRKISRLLDQGILEVAISTQDRRVPIYNLSERIRVFLRQSEIMNDIFP